MQSIQCLGEVFAVFRGEDGTVNVLDAYCPHLGANMGVGGVVKGNCLECPFHGWLFDGETGSCSHIPYAKKGKVYASILAIFTNVILTIVTNLSMFRSFHLV